MSRTGITTLVAAFAPLVCAWAMATQKMTYPQTKKVDQVDEFFGTRVEDPYRWLEDADSPETRAWIEAQNKLTFGYLSGIPERSRIRSRMMNLLKYERFGVPSKEGGRYFFTKNDGLQNQSVLYVANSLSAKPRVLLDPNKLSKDGTVALAGYAISRDGNYMAYGLASAGSDWTEWRVRDVRTLKDLPDRIRWVKFSGASWTKDGKGFFYSRYDAPAPGAALQAANYYHKLYFHRIGTDQSEDVLIYHRPDEKEWGFGGQVTEDGRYLIITVWQGTNRENRVLFKDLADTGGSPIWLVKEAEAEYTFVGNQGATLWFVTDKDAPMNQLVSADVSVPGRPVWETVIPETSDKLEGVAAVGGSLLASYLHDAQTTVKRFSTTGTPIGEVNLPGIGTAGGFSGKFADQEAFYSFTSFTVPTTIYRYDTSHDKSTVFRKPQVKFNPEDYEVKQVFYTSKDGTRVPMFITHKKGIRLDGSNPTLLNGYGGFNVSQTPYFSVINLVWMEMGGVFAVANIRGGGEYGKAWHDGGRLKNKQNVFDDFIAAAEYLIAEKYTKPAKLAIEGGSNGGLLVGACVNQRPDLFGAALPAVGVMDMLRFHKFTIGWAWVSDYGSPDDPEDFKVLLSYSPYHNLKPGTSYPAVLVTTGDHDDRVVPAHSFKYAARLQECQAGPAPCLIRIETSAGHGGGKPISKVIEESADQYAFLVKNLQISLPASFGK